VLRRRPEPPDAGRHGHGRSGERIERGSRRSTGTTFLHTEPHHDDLMLGYLPRIVRHVRDARDTHYFACLTSGFTAVTNQFMLGGWRGPAAFLARDEFAPLWAEGYFAPANEVDRNRDVWQYLDGVASDNDDLRHEGIARRTIRDLIDVYDVETDCAGRARQRAEGVLRHAVPRQEGPERHPAAQGHDREYEAECIWGYFGWNCANVFHLRLGFYTGDIFTEEPTVERDVEPILEELNRWPDVVSVAFDPEGSGPDTHYKVLQATTPAIERYVERPARTT
jgi:glucosamine-6-phosphate deaminase